jgi:DNA polymerase-3 subunit delta
VKIHGNQLPQQLHGELPPVYWLSGDETLLLQEAADSIRAACQQRGFSEREIWHVDNAIAWDDLLLSANSLSLFAERKLIELRFSSAKPGDKAIKTLALYLKNPNPDCLLLIISPKLDPAAMRTKGFKQLEAQLLLVQIWPIEASKLPDWIAARLRQQGLSATREALQMLAERVAGNLLAAQQEIDKLALLAEGDTIDSDSVLRCVADSARYDVFDLTEQMLKGDARAVQRIIQGLRAEGTDATVLLWAISRELRRLAAIRQAIDDGQGIDAAIGKQGIWKKQQALFKLALKRLDRGQLYQAIATAKDVDSAIKGLCRGNPWSELSSLCLLVAGNPLFGPRPGRSGQSTHHSP